MFRFLLRFFAVFITCSAFVGLVSRPVLANIGTTTCDDNTGTCGTIGLDSSASCNNPPLLWHSNSNNYGTYTLTAQYERTPFHAYYKNGSCYARSDFTYYQDPTVAYYQDSYTILGLDDIPTISLPSGGNYAFDGWTTCWAPCDDLSNVSDCSQTPVLPGSFNWSKDKCLVLTGNCTIRQCENGQWFDNATGECKSCPDGYNYSDSGATSMAQCYKIKEVPCQPQEQALSEYCTEPAEWEESCDCDETLNYRIYSNAEGTGEGQYTDANGNALPSNTPPAAPTCTLGVTFATGVSGYVFNQQTGECDPIGYKLEYNCGKRPDSNDDVGGTPPSATTGIQIGGSATVKDYTDGQCQSTGLTFQRWSCVWKEHESPYSVVGNPENHTAGDVITPWLAYDMECTAVWKNSILDCPDAYPEHDEEVTSYTQCYRITTTSSCDKQGNTTAIQNHCIYNMDCSCDPVTYRVYSNESGNADGLIKNEDGSQVLSNIPAPSCQRQIVGNPTGAEDGYAYNQQTNTCEALPTYPVVYDCNNNGLGTDGNGTNPSDSNSPYAAGNAVNVLAYPAGCQAPTERVADATLGWECVAQDGTLVYSGSGNADFNMPSQPVTCTAQWKSTAWSITYMGCNCDTPSFSDLFYNKCTQDLTSRVKSGEYETNDSSTYYRTFTATRPVTFPTVAGNTNYGEINVASTAFGEGWFYFVFDSNDYPIYTVSSSNTVSAGEYKDLIVYTCLGDSYQVTYNCIKGNGGTQVKGPYQKQSVSTLGRAACPYEPGWTFTWNCGGSYTSVTPGGSIYVDSDKVCNAEWTCDTANGYVLENGQCVKKYNLKFNCNNSKDSVRTERLLSGATFDTSSVQCQTKNCSETDYTWSCNPSSALSGNTVTMPVADVTCTAQWTPIKYTVTYNSGSCGSAGHTNETLYTHSDGATCGVGYSVPSNATSAMNNVLQSGYTFVGWNTNSGQTTSNWSGGNITGDITVYAACKSIEYNLTLRCNDNATDERTASYNAGESVGLVSTERNGCANDTDGMIFSHWTCAPSSLYDNSNVTMNNNVVCDAHWDTKYHLTYDCANDRANENPIGDWYDSGELVTTLTDNDRGTCSTLPYEGAEFKGWSCSPSNNRNGSTGAMTMPPSNVECTAQWDGAEFTVTYDCSGTTVTGGHVKNSENTQRTHENIKYGSSSFTFDQANNVCEYAHYTPANWTCVREDTEQDITSTISFGVSEKWKRPYNVKCTTDWIPEPVTLTYNCNNNGLGTSSNPGQNPQGGTYDYNTRVAMVEGDGGCKVPATGKNFKGWNCSPDSPDDDGYITLTTDTTCTADWGDAEYYLTYDCNGGTGNPPRDEDENGNPIPRRWTEVVQIKNNTCQKEGFSFVYWDCQGDFVNPFGNYYMPAANVTCYAQWKTQDFQLKYNCNNGGLGTNPASQTYAAGTPNIQVLSNTNYSTCRKPTSDKNFQGWNCHKEGDTGTTFVSGSAMPAYNVVCDGQWGDAIWNITYIGCRSGNCYNCSDPWILNDYVNVAKRTYSSTTIPAIIFPVPGRTDDYELFNTIEDEGYYFDGAWADQYGTSKSSTLSLLGDLTLCTNLKPYYEVTYDCGWEHQAPVDENNPYVSDSKVSVKNSSTCGDTARDGYTFINWSCKPDGQSAFDVAGSGGEFNITADTTCTAVWDTKGYVIRYHGGTAGGRNVTQVAMSNQAVSYRQENVVLKKNTFAIAGYEFNGWDCKVNGTSISGAYLSDQANIGTYSYTDNMDCTAQWSPLQYNIIYNKGSCDGTSYTSYDALTYDDTYTVLGLYDSNNMTVFAPVGYVFTGWRTVDTVIQNPDRIPGQTYGPWTTAGDLNLYATCEREPYYVTYDCDTYDEDSVTPVDEKAYYVDNTVSLKQNTCKKTGWSPVGWECYPLTPEISVKGMSNALVIYDDNTFSMPADNVKCDMRWEQDVYHVTYECRGDTDCDTTGSNCQTPQDNQEYEYGDSVLTATNTCKKSGYDFVKWNCAGQDVGAGRTFGIYDDTLCYAVWNPKQYNVVYQSGNCESRGTHVTQTDYNVLTYGQNFTVDDISDSGVNVRNGYEFLGWSTSLVTNEDLETNSFEPEYVSGQTYGPWNTDDDLILHAVCKKKVYNICYNFQVQGAKWKDSNANPLYSYDVDVESTPVHLAVHEDNGVGNFYVFDAWYNTPGMYHDQNDTGTKITEVPSAAITPLDTPMSVRCNGTISSPQCENSAYASCDVVLYAKWREAGKIRFACSADDYVEEKDAVNSFIEAANPEYVGCDLEGCDFDAWHCENYTGSPKDYVPEEDSIQVLVANTTVICTPIKDCSNLEYDIEYHVYKNGEEASEVYTNDGQYRVNVSNLKPDTYSPGDEPVAYPVVSWPDCRFTGWYENPQFTGRTVTQTPALAIDEEGHDIVLYGQMICETTCNEPGHEHWFHIGNNPNDKVCLYEKRPTDLTPAVRVKGANREPYYMMLSTDPDMIIHEGSAKRMRIQHSDGNIYNVCDKTSCGDLVPIYQGGWNQGGWNGDTR